MHGELSQNRYFPTTGITHDPSPSLHVTSKSLQKRKLGGIRRSSVIHVQKRKLSCVNKTYYRSYTAVPGRVCKGEQLQVLRDSDGEQQGHGHIIYLPRAIAA